MGRIHTYGARRRVGLTAALLASTALSAVPAWAQDTAPAKPASGPIEKVTVTAQKRSQALQDVPASVQVISTKRIEELQIDDVNDYSKFLPSVTIQPTSPGFVGIYMRGVASGENRNHSGPMPSVGTYLDEIPITTIQGALDIHVYDVERIEALAGPQGTLYGANSQSGTLRIITNKPDPGEFSASYNVELNSVESGGIGGGVEGHVNAPLSDNAAIRIVGWSQHDAGYIDNVAGTRFYPTSGILDNNFAIAQDDYNEVDTYGARAALRIDLDDSWTVMPMVMAQDEKTEGVFFYDPAVGDLAVTHWFPENTHDRWALAALTIEGKVANLDITYAGGYLDRTIDSNMDYADYGFFYDTVLGYGSYFTSDGVTPILPTQYIIGRDGYTKESHELRLASPGEDRFRFIAGLFYQRQVHDIYQRYLMNGLFDDHEVTTLNDTIWLTSQKRIDVDKAVFGEISYDLTPKLTATAGLRVFKAENSLEGFFGFSGNFTEFYGYDISTPEARAVTPGELACFAPANNPDAPCTNLNKLTEEDGTTHRLNLSYKIDDDRMIYATWSTGYRPGGVNRRGSLPPYASDYLTNYEIGWKTTLADGRLRFNGAFYWEEWEDFQFSFLGLNGLTQIQNAGAATIKGVEADILWAVTDAFTLNGSMNWIDTEFSGGPDFPPATPGLPVAPDFKANLTGRYTFELAGLPAYAQGVVIHASEAGVDLREAEAAIIGNLPSYTMVDLSFGFDAASFTLDFYVHNLTDERAIYARGSECQISVCGGQPYDAVAQPRTYGIKFGQRF
jgi:outer membrane receptor protein involved in Fe transport